MTKQETASAAPELVGNRPATGRPEPFLHVESERLYNPLTNRYLEPHQGGYGELRSAALGQASLDALSLADYEALTAGGWIVEDSPALSRRFLLKYASLEAHTSCNQGCYFCPVAEHPRESFSMPLDFYEQVVEQLAEFRHTLEGVSMINYNEPTIDKRFVEQVGILVKHRLPPAVLTNATGLTPERTDAILALGGLKYLSVNLSTLDRERYAADRRGDHLRIVLKNLDYVKRVQLAETMEIAVLGQGDENHKRDFAQIRERFDESCFTVKYYEVMNRAGNVPIGLRPKKARAGLCGCEQTGSRPVQWVHITPHGKVVLCCQDYFDRHVVGDLHEEPLRDILSGEPMSLLRRWVYGMEEAPADFLCRDCIYALTR